MSRAVKEMVSLVFDDEDKNDYCNAKSDGDVCLKSPPGSDYLLRLALRGSEDRAGPARLLGPGVSETFSAESCLPCFEGSVHFVGNRSQNSFVGLTFSDTFLKLLSTTGVQ